MLRLFNDLDVDLRTVVYPKVGAKVEAIVGQLKVVAGFEETTNEYEPAIYFEVHGLDGDWGMDLDAELTFFRLEKLVVTALKTLRIAIKESEHLTNRREKEETKIAYRGPLFIHLREGKNS